MTFVPSIGENVSQGSAIIGYNSGAIKDPALTVAAAIMDL